jgi:hypothetical protein
MKIFATFGSVMKILATFGSTFGLKKNGQVPTSASVSRALTVWGLNHEFSLGSSSGNTEMFHKIWLKSDGKYRSCGC